MLDKSSKIAVIMPTRAEVDLFTMCLGALKFRNFTAFTSADEAFEVVTRQLFDVFITRMEMPDTSGIVFIQKIRETGNYGNEAHLFVCNQLDSKILNVLHELDIAYALAQPISSKTISAKLAHLIATENALSPFERRYRDARSAYFNKIYDMADELAAQLNAEDPNSDKVLILLGDIAARQGNAAKTVEAYTRALKINNKSAVAAHKLAGAFMANGEHRRAADLLNQLVKLNPYNLRLLENAGLSNYNVKDYEKAAVYAKDLKGLDKSSKGAGELSANVQIATGNYAGLVDSLKGSHDDKAIVQFLNNAGVKLAHENDAEGALQMYQSCTQQLEGSKYLYAVYYNMGIAFKKLGKIDQAIASYDRSLRLKPDFDKAVESRRELVKLKAG